MRIVKLSDLSEEDKKKIQERQIQNIRTSKKNRIESNKKFNELISKKGEFDTSKHTSTVGRLQKAYKYNETTKKSLDDYYKNNTTSLWKGTQDFVDTAGKIGENTYKGTENGVLSAIQNLGRNMFNLQGMKEEENIFDKVNRQILNSRTELSSAEKSNIIDKMNNYSSQKDLINVIEEKNQKFQEKKNENTLKIQQNTDSTSNPVGKYLAGEIAPGIGQMLPGMLPGIGTTYFISSATGNYHDDAIQRGMTEDQATIYSGTMGIIEGALESLGAKLTKNVGKQLLKKNIKGALVNYGLDIGENFLEESIVEPISEIAAGMYGGKDKADWSNVPQRMIESGVAGALTSAITGGASAIVGGVGSKVTQQNQYVDYNTNKKLDKDSQNWLKQAENIIQENSTPQLLPQLTHNQQNINTQQITPTISNNVQNGGSEQNNSILNNKDVPMLNYQYEKSDNAKINNLRQDANKYFNNSEKAKNYVNMLEQIINDKNIDIRLDSNLKTPDGKVANGSYLNGVITINPNSTKAGEFIAVHELTHAIGTDSMRNIIETYRKSNIEFNTAMENLLQNYNSTELTDEALSDVSAQLFGNQEFINNISQNNPNIFKRIYNEIKYLWHQFRGYKNQDQFIDDLYYKWTQAYNSNKQLNDTNNYSIAGKEGMINAIKTDSRNLELERNHNKAQQMQMSGNDNETIRQATGWFQDRNGDWKFEFSDKDMSLKNIKLEKNKTYRLGDILEHDTLFTVYPKLKNYKVKFTNLNQSNGVYNIFDKDIKINNNQLDKKQYKSNIEGTLIHEIQHAIQDIENFEGGKSSKKSKLAYYESLGEIEASDTKARFLQEKYKNMDLTNTAPESSKTNPKHQNLEKYLKNRKILDKAKDGVYNYIKKRNEGNYEISKENISKNKKQNMGLVDGRKRRGYVDEIYQGDIETNIEESKLRKIKIDSNGEGKYIDNDGKEYPVFFRFDMDGAFRGKNHKSGVSMWEETIGDMIDDNYECEWDVDENLVERNTLLEKYGVTQEQYDNMNNEEQFKIQQQIALDEGYVTDGASVFDLSNDGIDFFINYEKDHHYLDAPEVHFFTGDITGEGADGENIVIPDKILLKTTSKDIQDIYDEIFYKYDLNDLQAREKANKEFTQRIVDLINKKSSNNESENNSGSFSFDKNAKRYEDLKSANIVKFNKKTDGTINIEISNNNELVNQFTVTSKENASKQLGNNIANYIYENATETNKTINLKQTETAKVQDTSNKGKQLEIIKNTNPMLDDYHTGIRNIEDIKTFDEVINDDGESFAWGDFSKEDAEKALKDGKVTVYSSYPIKQGTFVSTSRIQAEEYAGGRGNRVYSKTIPLDSVAWINGDEGQYANTNQKYSLKTDKWQNYLADNFKAEGTKTNLAEIKGIAPIAQSKTKKAPIVESKQNNTLKAPYRTSEQIANDKNISDLDAIKEESVKVNTPTVEEANRISNQIGKSVPPNVEPPQSPTIDLINKKRSKEKASLKQIKDTLAQKFVNKGHYIDKLAKETGNKKLTYLYDRTMNTFNEAQISIGDRQVITNKDGTDVEVVGKSIMDIFSEADGANLSNEFDDYLLNKHNISRFAHEKGIFGKQISSTDSQRIVSSYEKQHPEFVKWSKEVSSYNDNNLKDLVRNGLVSEETYKKLRKMYSDYVPTFRDITENITQYQDDSVGGNTLQKATQSNKSILSVKESMAEQTLAIKKAIRINKLGVELYKTLGKASKVNESVSGIDFDPVAIQTLAGDVIAKAKDGTNTFMIFQDGEMTEFKISDELYSAFSKDMKLENRIKDKKWIETIEFFRTPFEKVNNAHRELLTTYSIGFAFNNPIKDFQDALFNTKYSSSQFLKNYTKALYNIGTKGSWYQNYKDNGGTANTYFDYEKGILPNKNKRFGDKIKVVNEILEQAPRLAEYISTIENGGSINEALYNAADITTNFKRGGDITKVVNKYGANFLNASVQGLDKFYRNLSGQNGWKGYAKLAIKAVVWQVAPAVLNGLLLGDDDDYDDLPEYTKDNYFLFKIEDGKFFRIPKGRISSVVGGIARRALETVQGKDVDWKALTDTTINQMAPNNPLKDNIVAPIAQASSNKSWFGGEIVSSRLQKLPVAEQSDESTDKLSKFLGERLKISPKKINYVLDQYSGGIGDVILPMLTPQAENNIFEDKFTTDAVMKDKHVSEYYSQLEELERNKNSEKSTDVDKLKYMYLSGSSKELGKLYQKKRDIQNSDLSDKEKKKQVRDMQMKINAIVENKLNNVDSVRKNEDTATIGNEKYYKYKDEWKKVSDEEAEKMKGISLITYANYQNKVATLSEEKKNKDENITQKDKVKILINSNYTGKEKDKIYSQIINTDDTTYQILKRLDNNKDIINQYLDYLQADLKADREDDGTEKGRAVSGSKKKKVYNYINSIDNKNMSYVQKLYLTGVNTTLSTAEKKKIFTLINENKSLTKEDKLEALDKLQGFTIYKDGKVKW